MLSFFYVSRTSLQTYVSLMKSFSLKETPLQSEWSIRTLEVGARAFKQQLWIIAILLSKTEDWSSAIRKTRALRTLRQLLRPVIIFKQAKAVSRDVLNSLEVHFSEPPPESVLRRNKVLSVLPEQMISQIRKQLKRSVYPSGSLIACETDNNALDLFIVGKGIIEILIRNELAPGFRHIKRVKEQDSFGECALLTGQSRLVMRVASGTSIAVTWSLRRLTFTALLSAASSDTRKQLNDISLRLRKENLPHFFPMSPHHFTNCGRTTIFETWSTEMLEGLLPYLIPTSTSPGTVMVEEGMQSKGLYIVVNGYVEVVKKKESMPQSSSRSPNVNKKIVPKKFMSSSSDIDDEIFINPSSPTCRRNSVRTWTGPASGLLPEPLRSEIRLKVLGLWSVFGVEELVTSEPNKATVRAMCDVDCWFLPKSDFINELLKYPHEFLSSKTRMEDIQIARLSEGNVCSVDLLRADPILSIMPSRILYALANAADLNIVPLRGQLFADSAVCKIYIIAKGKVRRTVAVGCKRRLKDTSQTDNNAILVLGVTETVLGKCWQQGLGYEVHQHPCEVWVISREQLLDIVQPMRTTWDALVEKAKKYSDCVKSTMMSIRKSSASTSKPLNSPVFLSYPTIPKRVPRGSVFRRKGSHLPLAQFQNRSPSIMHQGHGPSCLFPAVDGMPAF